MGEFAVGLTAKHRYPAAELLQQLTANAAARSMVGVQQHLEFSLLDALATDDRQNQFRVAADGITYRIQLARAFTFRRDFSGAVLLQHFCAIGGGDHAAFGGK